MGRLKAVLFDVDGVLLDSTAANAAFYRELFCRAGAVGPSDEAMKSHNHFSVEHMLRRNFPDFPDQKIKQLIETVKTITAGRELLRLMDGVIEIIPALAQNYKLGIVTNRMRSSLQPLWDLSGLREYFSAVAAYEDTQRHKPDPDPVQFALQRVGVSPTDAVFIGDSESDLRAGLAAGVKVILLSSQSWPEAHRVISSLYEMPVVLDAFH